MAGSPRPSARSPAPPRARALACVLALVLAPAACDGDPPEVVGGDDGDSEGAGGAALAGPLGASEPDDATLDLARDAVLVYVVDWSWEGAAREGDAWVFTNDLGYTIGIEAAYVGTVMIGMAACDASGAAPIVEDPRPAALAAPTGARAHVSGSDSSNAVVELVEVAHASPTAIFGAGLASGDAYCGLLLLTAPLDAVAADGEVFDDQSARFAGWWSAPGETEKHVLEARINLQQGSVRPLAGGGAWPTIDGVPGFAAAALTITRRPAAAFDGLDLAALSPAEIAYEALGGLVRGAEVEVALAE